MTLIPSQPMISRVRYLRTAAHLLMATLLWGSTQTAWGQGLGESRWSTSNPPTPAMIDPAKEPQDNGLRRLPPIDQEEAARPKPSSVTASEKPDTKPEIAAKPQSAPAIAQKAEPVDWSNPNIVIGPENSTRMVSHEEVVTAPQPKRKPSRYSSTPQPAQTAAPKTQSRFTQAAAEKAPAQVERSTEKPAAPIFARVFDEQVESAEITQPEVATGDSDLSPIFACRLLGLRATKSEATTVR